MSVLDRIKSGEIELYIAQSWVSENPSADELEEAMAQDVLDKKELLELADIGKYYGWTSIKDKLPEKEDFYFARYKCGKISTGTFFEDRKKFNNGVTHWMEIPPIN